MISTSILRVVTVVAVLAVPTFAFAKDPSTVHSSPVAAAKAKAPPVASKSKAPARSKQTVSSSASKAKSTSHTKAKH